MQEGTVGFWQIAKTTTAVLALRQVGLPYICVFGHPTVGGVLAVGHGGLFMALH